MWFWAAPVIFFGVMSFASAVAMAVKGQPERSFQFEVASALWFILAAIILK